MTNEEILKKMFTDKAVRRAIVRRSHKMFFSFYFSDYMEHPSAQLHDEIFKITEIDEHSMFVLSAFRGSGKSTLLSLSYIIWSIINGSKKYVLIISENQHKAQTLLGHIKSAFETNEILKRDFGPFQEDRKVWNAVSLVLNNYGSKITAVSDEQKRARITPPQPPASLIYCRR